MLPARNFQPQKPKDSSAGTSLGAECSGCRVTIEIAGAGPGSCEIEKDTRSGSCSELL
jgi:hypothetical protein